MKIKIATEKDLKNIEDLWQICFNDPPNWLKWYLDEVFPKTYFLCCYDGDKLVSMAHMAYYDLRIRGKVIPAGTFSATATKPEYRNQGLVTNIMRQISSHAYENGVAMMFYNSNKPDGRYSSLHFEGADILEVNIKNTLNGRMLCEKFKPDMFDELLNCYLEFAKRYSGIVFRNDYTMQKRLDDHFADNGEVIVARKNGKTTGYAIYLPEEKIINAQEIVANNEESLNMLIDSLISIANGKLLNLILPEDTLSSVENYDFTIKPFSVICAVNVQKILKTLNLSSPYIIQIKDHVIPQNEGIYTTLGETTEDTPDIILNSGRFAQLAAGYKSIYELVNMNVIEAVNKSSISGIDKVFPKQNCYVFEPY